MIIPSVDIKNLEAQHEEIKVLIHQLIAAQLVNQYHYRISRLKKKNATDERKVKVLSDLLSEWVELSQAMEQKIQKPKSV